MCEILESDEEWDALLGQRRPTSDEEDEFLERDAMACDM